MSRKPNLTLFFRKSEPKTVKKVVFSGHANFPKFRCTLTNRHFWPLLANFIEKIRSDSKSSVFFTSTCTKPIFFLRRIFFILQSRHCENWPKKRSFLGTFLGKSRFWRIFTLVLRKWRVPPESSDFLPSIHLYIEGSTSTKNLTPGALKIAFFSLKFLKN